MVERRLQHAAFSNKDEAQRIIDRSEKKANSNRKILQKQMEAQ